MQTYQLGIDTWEGQLEIDESVLKANGVKFIFVRLNDISGGHHKDALFDKQWKEAAAFYRAPYFVYNPWASAQANYDWLVANVPADAKAVACDIEVVYSGISAAKYAADVIAFRVLVAKKWRHVVYTGEWFLSYLSKWDGGDYWWAQYPLSMYPSATQSITWDQLKAKINLLTRPANENKCPGRVLFWQCAADRYILPGNARTMDINVFFGTDADLAVFFGGVVPEPAPTDLAEIKANIAQIAGAIATLHSQHGTILSDIANVKSDTEKILAELATGGTPTQPPASSDGYTGPTLGIYEIISTGTDNNSFQPLNGDGGYSTIMQDRTANWMAANCLGWDDFVHPAGNVKPTVERKPDDNGEMRWYITSKAVLGCQVRVAEIVSGRARIVGMDADGDPRYAAVNLDACSPEKTPYYFHKIPNVPRQYPIIQPRGKDKGGYHQAWWIPAGQLRKVA